MRAYLVPLLCARMSGHMDSNVVLSIFYRMTHLSQCPSVDELLQLEERSAAAGLNTYLIRDVSWHAIMLTASLFRITYCCQ